MKCYLCGSNLGRSSRCPACNSDVRDYKRIVANSNVCYNRALEKAAERDLSGAMENLKQSLMFYKGNTNARNLLGLVYYELGELVPALSEWVISKSLQPVDNLAEEYLNRIQKNQSHLEKCNSNVKRYNMALQYCNQDSFDLAILQLKKIGSSGYPILKAYQLLALLYIKTEEYDKARSALRSASKMDVNNTITLRYQRELSTLIRESGRRKKKTDGGVRDGGNDDYVGSGRGFGSSLLAIFLNLLVGVVAGSLAVYFLVVPGVKATVMTSSNNQVREANERLASKEAMVQSYETQIDELNNKIAEMESTASGDAAITSQYSRLLEAYAAYVAGDTAKATEYYATIDKTALGAEATDVYEQLATNLNPSLMASYYELAQAANEEQDTDTAIYYYEKMIALDDSYLNGGLLYELAEAYSRKGRNDDALTYFERVATEYPESNYAGTAVEKIEEMQD